MFTSPRERRLWLWSALVTATIYATLGLARTLAGALRSRGVLDVAFVVAALMLAAAVVTIGLRARPGTAEIGIAVGVAAVYLLAFVRMALPEERTHLIEWGLVAVLVLEALRERAARGRPVRVPALVAFAVAALLGVVDEAIQLVIPSRVFDPVDIFVNAVAAAMAVSAAAALRWAGDRRKRGL